MIGSCHCSCTESAGCLSLREQKAICALRAHVCGWIAIISLARVEIDAYHWGVYHWGVYYWGVYHWGVYHWGVILSEGGLDYEKHSHENECSALLIQNYHLKLINN